MLVMATVDDISGEIIPYFIERTMESGANNVHILNAMTKKGRTEYIVFIDVNEDSLDSVCMLLALEFGTIGVKVLEASHRMLPFEIKSGEVSVTGAKTSVRMPVRIKYLKKDGRVISLKAEYEDLKSLAGALSNEGVYIALSKLKSIIEAEAFGKVLGSENIHINVT